MFVGIFIVANNNKKSERSLTVFKRKVFCRIYEPNRDRSIETHERRTDLRNVKGEEDGVATTKSQTISWTGGMFGRRKRDTKWLNGLRASMRPKQRWLDRVGQSTVVNNK